MLMGAPNDPVDLDRMARHIADEAVADAETRNRTAKYASHLFREHIERAARNIMGQVVRHERERIWAEARASKVRPSLNDRVAACDLNAPIGEAEREWMADAPVGQERL